MTRTALGCCAALALTPLIWAGPAQAGNLEALDGVIKLQSGVPLSVAATMSPSLPSAISRPAEPAPEPRAAVPMRPQDPVLRRVIPGGPAKEVPRSAHITVIKDDFGGKIADYWGRYKLLASQGGDIEIRGSCESACTLITSVVPKERLCFSDYAVLRFHKVRMPDGTPTTHYTQEMVDSYPADIRGWIATMGGVEQMPLEHYWKLTAPQLWKMGYRRCD